MIDESANLEGNFSGFVSLDGEEPNLSHMYTPVVDDGVSTSLGVSNSTFEPGHYTPVSGCPITNRAQTSSGGEATSYTGPAIPAESPQATPTPHLPISHRVRPMQREQTVTPDTSRQLKQEINSGPPVEVVVPSPHEGTTGITSGQNTPIKKNNHNSTTKNTPSCSSSTCSMI